MAYDGKILRRAQAQFEEDRAAREENFRRKRESVYARRPRLKEIDGELRSTMSRIISSALRRGTDPRPAMGVLRDRNLTLQEERTALLAELGLPADYLEEKPLCPLCRCYGAKGNKRKIHRKTSRANLCPGGVKCVVYSSNKQTAWQAIPSPAPVKPKCSSVVAFTLTRLGAIPSLAAMFSSIWGR